MPSTQYKLLVSNARQVVQVSANRELYLTGEAMNNLVVLEEGDGPYNLVVGRDGLIKDIGKTSVLADKYKDDSFDQTIDAQGLCVLPGFVDSHTHPVWSGDRVQEFAMKLAGATYMDIHKKGGGIHFTVECTRKATEEELFQSLRERLSQMVRCGSTLVECKSGYGLDCETETKMLRVIERARKEMTVDISTTYCGAHAVPRDKSAEEATNDVIDVQLPSIQKLMTSGDLHVDNIDVFCEKGVFDIDQSKKILKAGKDMGLLLNFHGEELNRLFSAEMGADLGARAISHLEEVSEAGVRAMSRSKTAAVLLPTTAYNLKLPIPPARAMIEEGVIVALGTDFNPNAYCLSMPLVMNLACVTLKMSMPEALVASTLNSAYALGRSETHGSLEVGKVGSMVLLDAPSWQHLIYQMGCHQHLIRAVTCRGDLVHTSNHSQDT